MLPQDNYPKLYHITPGYNILSIDILGLLPNLATGRRKCVYVCKRAALKSAIVHICKRHKCQPEDLVICEIADDGYFKHFSGDWWYSYKRHRVLRYWDAYGYVGNIE